MKDSSRAGFAVAASLATSAADSRRDNIWSAAFPCFRRDRRRIRRSRWDFSILGEVDQPKRWTWDEFHTLPRETVTKDIHCVTKWSKLDTHWEGVSLDTLLAPGRVPAPVMLLPSATAAIPRTFPWRSAGREGVGSRHL